MKISFLIPRKPIASPRPKISTYGGYPRAYFPKNYTVEKEMIKDLFVNDFGMSFSTYNGNVEVEIEFYLPLGKTFKGYNGRKATIATELYATKPHNQKPDLDNLAKTYLDALNEIAWEDDSHISKLSVSKHWSFTPKVIMNINYTDVSKKEDIATAMDKKELEEKELIDNIYKERYGR